MDFAPIAKVAVADQPRAMTRLDPCMRSFSPSSFAIPAPATPATQTRSTIVKYGLNPTAAAFEMSMFTSISGPYPSPTAKAVILTDASIRQHGTAIAPSGQDVISESPTPATSPLVGRQSQRPTNFAGSSNLSPTVAVFTPVFYSVAADMIYEAFRGNSGFANHVYVCLHRRRFRCLLRRASLTFTLCYRRLPDVRLEPVKGSSSKFASSSSFSQ